MTHEQLTKSLLLSNLNHQMTAIRQVIALADTMSGLAERQSDATVTLNANSLDTLFEQISDSLEGVWHYLDQISVHLKDTDSRAELSELVDA